MDKNKVTLGESFQVIKADRQAIRAIVITCLVCLVVVGGLIIYPFSKFVVNAENVDQYLHLSDYIFKTFAPRFNSGYSRTFAFGTGEDVSPLRFYADSAQKVKLGLTASYRDGPHSLIWKSR